MPPGWPATRARILARDPWCWCLRPATEVHHLLPGVEDDWALRGLCADCHRVQTQAQAAAARRGGDVAAVAAPGGAYGADAASTAQRGAGASQADSGQHSGAARPEPGRGGTLGRRGVAAAPVAVCPVPGSAGKSAVGLGAEDGRRETWPAARLVAPSRPETASPAWLQGGADPAVSRVLGAVPAMPDLTRLGAELAAFTAGVKAMAEVMSAALAPIGAAMAQAFTSQALAVEPTGFSSGQRAASGDPCGEPHPPFTGALSPHGERPRHAPSRRGQRAGWPVRASARAGQPGGGG
jgi:hypothetical protein